MKGSVRILAGLVVLFGAAGAAPVAAIIAGTVGGALGLWGAAALNGRCN